ncbi:hypothetical protein L7F22_061377 [Adiantum nelumboides]|nr:hypothetical protein [Adiantum nelumboides]
MVWSDFLIFTGDEDAETWLQVYGLFLLKVGLSEDEGMQQVFSLLMRGKAKHWFDGLHDEVKTGWDTLEKAFREKYMPTVQLHEVKKKLDDLKQRLDGDFKDFESEFEALWRKLLEVTTAKNCDYLN